MMEYLNGGSLTEVKIRCIGGFRKIIQEIEGCNRVSNRRRVFNLWNIIDITGRELVKFCIV